LTPRDKTWCLQCAGLFETRLFAGNEAAVVQVWYGIVEFNVALDTL